MSRARTGRRSETFGVRRWLQLGAASAGMGAAMWGLSLVGPQVGTAAADEGASKSASSSSASSKDTASKDSSSTKRTTTPKGAEKPDSAEDARSSERATRTTRTAARDRHTEDAAATKSKVVESDNRDAAAAEAPGVTDTRTTKRAPARVAPVEDVVAEPRPEASVAESVTPMAVADPWAMQASTYGQGWWQWETSVRIEAFTDNVQGFIDAMPVAPQFRDGLNGTVWTVRRTFFNLAPTVAQPVEITSADAGPIIGRVIAVDPEGDAITYRLSQGPKYGVVQLNSDGSYTYTPGSGFDGVDTFAITAADTGLHVNLIDWFQAPARVGMLVNQGAIEFDFNFTTGSAYWTSDRVDALDTAAQRVARYLLVTQPVTLQYDVTGVDDIDAGWLASASSSISSSGKGYWNTVVQQKLQTGVDANGADPDSTISWNWGYDWALGDVVTDDEYDFISTAMHEFMHSLGFTTRIRRPGMNGSQTIWTSYDEYVSTASGERPIGSNYLWDTDFDGYLTGAGGGLYFHGANAMAAYGGRPVPLWTPNPFEPGSSVSHLRDSAFTGADRQMMNAYSGTGRDVRVLSAIELGILADLGYTVVPNAAMPSVTSMDPAWLWAA